MDVALINYELNSEYYMTIQMTIHLYEKENRKQQRPFPMALLYEFSMLHFQSIVRNRLIEQTSLLC